MNKSDTVPVVRDRAEHVIWAKERAATEANKTSSVAAWFGFKHDMHKHDEIRDDPAIAFLFERGDDLCRSCVLPMMQLGTRVPLLEQKLRRFIEDFN